MKVKIFQTRVDAVEDLPKIETVINEWMEGREVVSVNAYAHQGLSVVVVSYEGDQFPRELIAAYILGGKTE